MEKVYFLNYTKQQINVSTEGGEIQVGPQCEEWLTLPVGPVNVTLAAYLVGFKKKRESFQIEIKEGTNYVDILMDEEVQKNLPTYNNWFFLLIYLPWFLLAFLPLDFPRSSIDFHFFILDISQYFLVLGIFVLAFHVYFYMKAQRRIKQLSTVFVLDAH